MSESTPNTTQSMKLLSYLLAIIIIISIGIVAYTTFVPPVSNQEDNQTPKGTTNETTLLLSFQDEQINYTLSELQNMEPITGYGGYRTRFPAIKGTGNYTGIAITTVIEPFTQNLDNYSISVVASDGYINNYTYQEIHGNVPLYNASNVSDPDPITIGGVTMVLAYEYENTPLDPEEDGSFKIAYVDGASAITSSKYWAKYVVEIIVHASTA